MGPPIIFNSWGEEEARQLPRRTRFFDTLQAASDDVAASVRGLFERPHIVSQACINLWFWLVSFLLIFIQACIIFT